MITVFLEAGGHLPKEQILKEYRFQREDYDFHFKHTVFEISKRRYRYRYVSSSAQKPRLEIEIRESNHNGYKEEDDL